MFHDLANRLVLCVTVAAVLFSDATSAHAAKPSKPGGGGDGTALVYTLVDLGGFTGGDPVQAWAQAVNNPDSSGLLRVVGHSFAPLPGTRAKHAALWDVTADGQILGLTDIAPPGYLESESSQVNDLGHVKVGGYIWIRGQGHVTLPGFVDGIGPGSPGLLNGTGDVLGSATDADGSDRVAWWHIESDGQIVGPVDLGDQDDFQGLNVFDMNNHGLMAGYSGPDAAIMWFDGQGDLQVQTIGTLDPQGISRAVAVSDSGVVAGNTIDRHGYSEAFVWTPEAGIVGLGTLGGLDSVASDVNNSGQIVGWSDNSSLKQVAFVWKDGRMFDLNPITDGGGGKNWIQIASGINDQGHVVGLLTRTKPVSEQHGFLLVPKTP